MRRRMAAVLSIAVAAGATMTATAPLACLVDDAGVMRIGAAGDAVHGERGAVAVAPGGVDVTAVGAEPVDPEPQDATAVSGGHGLRLGRGERGETAFRALVDVSRPAVDVADGLGGELGHARDEVLHVDRVGVVTLLPAVVFTLGAIIAAVGLSRYRRAV